MKDKKAQMEAIGLVIIVLLLALGMLFMLSTMGKENSEAQSIKPQDINLPQDTIDALKNIKIECNRPLMSQKRIGFDELIQDMAQSNVIFCDGENSKVYTERISKNIFNKTLVTWGKSFVFRVLKGNEVLLTVRTYSNGELPPQEIISLENIGDPTCHDLYDGSQFDKGNQGSQILPLRYGGNIEMILFICG